MESKTKSQRNVKKMRENEEANGTKSNAMRLKWKNDLGVLINGGNEIGEEIEAEKWLRRFVSR
jgi:hypothetical protein